MDSSWISMPADRSAKFKLRPLCSLNNQVKVSLAWGPVSMTFIDWVTFHLRFNSVSKTFIDGVPFQFRFWILVPFPDSHFYSMKRSWNGRPFQTGPETETGHLRWGALVSLFMYYRFAFPVESKQFFWHVVTTCSIDYDYLSFNDIFGKCP